MFITEDGKTQVRFPLSPFVFFEAMFNYIFMSDKSDTLEYSQAVRQGTLTLSCVGSNPATPVSY